MNREERASKCSNPQIAQWLLEWLKECKPNDNKIFVYNRALNSVLEATTVIKNCKDAQKLKGIGPFLLKKIERKIFQLRANGSLEFSEFFNENSNISSNALPNTISNISNKRPYVPPLRSVPFAALVGLRLDLADPNTKGYSLLADVLRLGQPYADCQLELKLASALKNLVDRDLVIRWGSPTRYSLSEDGIALADRLLHSTGVVGPLPIAPALAASFAEIERRTWLPHSFRIVLLVDNREVSSRQDRSFIVRRLEEMGVECVARALDLGDFLWIATDNHEEVVLDCIVERKREEDLAGSIVDGRFKEQKHRIQRSGISRPIYLVEQSDSAITIGEERFRAALVSTQVVDKLFLRYTHNLQDTLDFLAEMHQRFRAIEESSLEFMCTQSFLFDTQQVLSSASPDLRFTYSMFAQMVSKSANLTLQDLFVRMLSTIRQLSPAKAIEISRLFPTPNLLYTHFQSLSESERESYFKNLKLEGGKIGQALSHRISALFNAD